MTSSTLASTPAAAMRRYFRPSLVLNSPINTNSVLASAVVKMNALLNPSNSSARIKMHPDRAESLGHDQNPRLLANVALGARQGLGEG
jgi:hypothetical protein